MTLSRRNLLATAATQPFVTIIGDHTTAAAPSGYRGGLVSLTFDDGWRSSILMPCLSCGTQV
jgi:hypothetical protein